MLRIKLKIARTFIQSCKLIPCGIVCNSFYRTRSDFDELLIVENAQP